MLQILGIAAAKCSFSTVSGVKAANTRLRGGQMQFFCSSKCSGTHCAAFESWPMTCKTAVKHLLNTRRNSQKEEACVRKALRRIFQMQWYGMCGFCIVAYEMQNCCETLAEHWRNSQKEKEFVSKALRTIFKCSGTECAAFESWPMKCKTPVKHLLNIGRNSQEEEEFVRKALMVARRPEWQFFLHLEFSIYQLV